MDNVTEKSRRAMAKQEWNAEHYTQIKVSVDKKVAATFKTCSECEHSSYAAHANYHVFQTPR